MRLPKMYIYADTFLADTQHLSDTEMGCYCRLLFFNWKKNCTGLPNDMERLIRITHSEKEIILTILDEFFYIEDNKYHNKKLLEEFNQAMDFQEKQSANGRKGALARWNNGEANSSANGDPNSDANGESITTNTNTITNTNNNKYIYPLSEDDSKSVVSNSGSSKKQSTSTAYTDDFEKLWKSLSKENKIRSSKPSAFKIYSNLSAEDKELVKKHWTVYQEQQSRENGNFAKALERYLRHQTFKLAEEPEEKFDPEANDEGNWKLAKKMGKWWISADSEMIKRCEKKFGKPF